MPASSRNGSSLRLGRWRVDLLGQVLDGQLRLVAREDDHVLDDIAELAHVAGPGVGHQHAAGLRRRRP